MADEVVFLDTNGWIALLNASDTLHETAGLLWRDLGRRGYSIVLTDWVVAETGNGLARTPARQEFMAATETLLNSPRCRIVFITDRLLRQALELYRARADKRWGLVDCSSFMVMKDEGIQEALTNDRHFNQAGYRRLLPET